MKTAYFYTLAVDTPKVYVSTVCRLIDQLWKQRVSLYLHCPSLEIAQQFDNDLWTFKDTGFIPHGLITDESSRTTELPACVIGFPDAGNDTRCDILFNLAENVPAFFDRYQQVVELVAVNETERVSSRQHYKQYQKAGYAMKTKDCSAI